MTLTGNQADVVSASEKAAHGSYGVGDNIAGKYALGALKAARSGQHDEAEALHLKAAQRHETLADRASNDPNPDTTISGHNLDEARNLAAAKRHRKAAAECAVAGAVGDDPDDDRDLDAPAQGVGRPNDPDDDGRDIDTLVDTGDPTWTPSDSHTLEGLAVKPSRNKRKMRDDDDDEEDCDPDEDPDCDPTGNRRRRLTRNQLPEEIAGRPDLWMMDAPPAAGRRGLTVNGFSHGGWEPCPVPPGCRPGPTRNAAAEALVPPSLTAQLIREGRAETRVALAAKRQAVINQVKQTGGKDGEWYGQGYDFSEQQGPSRRQAEGLRSFDTSGGGQGTGGPNSTDRLYGTDDPLGDSFLTEEELQEIEEERQRRLGLTANILVPPPSLNNQGAENPWADRPDLRMM